MRVRGGGWFVFAFCGGKPVDLNIWPMEHVMVELCVRVLLMHLGCGSGYVLGYWLCLWFRVILHRVSVV